MRNFQFLAVFVCALLTSCSDLSKLHPVTSREKADFSAKCQSLFLTGDQQLSHSIEATMPGGGKSLMMGILVVSPESDLFESVIMTIEGLVIFNARYEQGKITVKRGISHFKSANFAAGLVNDIKLVFFKPAGVLIETGKTEDGFSVCRYQESNDNQVEITLKTSYWEIRRYDGDHGLRRSARVFPSEKNYLAADSLDNPRKIQLTAHDLFGYSLTLKLIEAVTK